MQQAQSQPISIVEAIDNQAQRTNPYGSLFQFGTTRQTEPTSTKHPYELRDSSLFQIPELSDFGSATPIQ
jgi:hypothetical protein